MSDLDSVLDQLRDIVSPVVVKIEGSAPITKDHYDEYMVAINKIADMLGKDDKMRKNVCIGIGVAMQRAGASKAGVQSALRIMGHL